MQRFLWPIGLLFVVTGVWMSVSGNQSDISERADAALQAVGLVGADISVEGRDIVVDVGTMEYAKILEVDDALSGLEGVRRVDFLRDGVALPSLDDGEVDDAASAPPVSVATTVAPGASSTTPSTTDSASATTAPASTTTSTTAAPTTTQTQDTTAPATNEAFVRLALSDGALLLAGQISDQAAAEGIQQVTDLVYAPLVDNQLVVSDGIDPAAWSAALPGAVAVLPIVGQADLRIRNDTATITAAARSDAHKQRLLGALQQTLGAAGLEIVDAVEVTGEGAPFFRAEATGDGTVSLEGQLPGDDVLQQILGAATAVYGQDNVSSTMTVDTSLERTFSVFRLPGIFPQFAPIPIWELITEEDGIRGGLRGGATFAYNSSALTAELRAVAELAAGVMIRNPDLTATIEGHTDSIGEPDYNQRLSERRANAAKDYLVQLGVGEDRITAVGFGEDQPIASNDTDAGQAINRRIDFQFGS